MTGPDANAGSPPRNVGVIGATGRVGGLVTAVAMQRGHRVTALVRDVSRLRAPVPAVERDARDLSRDDIADLDVLVNAFGVPVGREAEHLDVTRHLVGLLEGTATRLIVVGSGGHLFTDEERTGRYWQTEMVDSPLRDGARTLEQVYRMLQASAAVRWTYLAPPMELVREGTPTGRYRAGTDVVLRDDRGLSRLHQADYASALVDEVEAGAHPDQMFTVAT